MPVYLGTVFNQVDRSTASKVVEYVILILGFGITIVAALYLYRRMVSSILSSIED